MTKGLLYSYGAVDFNFLRTQISKFMNEIISKDELFDIYFKRLNLNLYVNFYNVQWTNNKNSQLFATYLDENDVNVFMKLYLSWYNNSPQYLLCGYSPNEFSNI